MRINQFVAQASGLSRRAADKAILNNRVTIDDHPAALGESVGEHQSVALDGHRLVLKQKQTLMLNKPPGYVCSRDGQGSKTIYNLLPAELHSLKPVGRLDKDSSGLLLLTNDGELANRLTHPSFKKTKVYEVSLNKPLKPEDQTLIEQGVELDDGPSSLDLSALDTTAQHWRVTMHEGRNRQIRRTFEHSGYRVLGLQRIEFGEYKLSTLGSGKYIQINQSS